MYNLYSVFAKCKSNLESMEIPVAKVVTVEINYRAHRRWGQCKLKPNGAYAININVDLLKEANPLSALQNTIYHELLHTCPNCMNHGSTWTSYASKVNSVTGLNIKRCSTSEEKGIVERREPKRVVHYIISCQSCGASWKRQRASKVIQNIKNYKCTCGGCLKVEQV